jgi:chromosome segregation ATPase
MSNDDRTLRVLTEIRDEIRSTNTRVDGLRDEIRATNIRVDGLRDELRAGLEATNDRLTESEIRTATAMNETTHAVRDVYVLLRDRFDLRDRVERCEREIEALRASRR